MTYFDPTSHKGLTTDSDIQILIDYSRGLSKDNCGTPADAPVQMKKASSTLISLLSVWLRLIMTL